MISLSKSISFCDKALLSGRMGRASTLTWSVRLISDRINPALIWAQCSFLVARMRKGRGCSRQSRRWIWFDHRLSCLAVFTSVEGLLLRAWRLRGVVVSSIVKAAYKVAGVGWCALGAGEDDQGWIWRWWRWGWEGNEGGRALGCLDLGTKMVTKMMVGDDGDGWWGSVKESTKLETMTVTMKMTGEVVGEASGKTKRRLKVENDEQLTVTFFIFFFFLYFLDLFSFSLFLTWIRSRVSNFYGRKFEARFCGKKKSGNFSPDTQLI